MSYVRLCCSYNKSNKIYEIKSGCEKCFFLNNTRITKISNGYKIIINQKVNTYSKVRNEKAENIEDDIFKLKTEIRHNEKELLYLLKRDLSKIALINIKKIAETNKKYLEEIKYLENVKFIDGEYELYDETIEINVYTKNIKIKNVLFNFPIEDKFSIKKTIKNKKVIKSQFENVIGNEESNVDERDISVEK